MFPEYDARTAIRLASHEEPADRFRREYYESRERKAPERKHQVELPPIDGALIRASQLVKISRFFRLA